MKRTEQERKERELKRSQKKVEVLGRKGAKAKSSVGECITDLAEIIFHDGTDVYNTEDDDRIVEFFMIMKDDQLEKDWDAILRKAIRKTGVKNKEPGFQKIKAIFDEI